MKSKQQKSVDQRSSKEIVLLNGQESSDQKNFELTIKQSRTIFADQKS